ncbi:MAG TPA: serpin family protein [Mycobacteriales bacterium]|nr:serpin family protein [Mycobacteriales bacterium]
MTAPDLTFALALHRLLAGERSFAWSPYSVTSALGVVAAGARGSTRDELAAVLGDLDALAAALAAGAALGSGPGSTVTLGVANTLWADLTLPVAAEYLAAVKSWPGGAARGADFRGAADAARQEINADVARSTRGLIEDLIQPGLIDAETRAVVVNALYLKAAWTAPFPKAETRPEPFRTPGGPVDVPTMHVTRQLPYAARDGWTLVSVPAGEGVVADVLLPPEGDLVPLDEGVLTGLLDSARQREVALSLPRVKVRGTASLVEPLAALGIRRLFSREADLSGVTGGLEGLRVDAAVHKAVLTLDEAGLEGAAATAVMMTRLAAITAPPRPIPVRVDRPFHLIVRHRPTGTLHFLTQVTDPR